MSFSQDQEDGIPIALTDLSIFARTEYVKVLISHLATQQETVDMVKIVNQARRIHFELSSSVGIFTEMLVNHWKHNTSPGLIMPATIKEDFVR